MSQKVSLRHIAKDLDVPRQTLKDRLDGKPLRNKPHEDSMHLTNIEETELVHWITTLTQHGYAPRYCTVWELAEIIRNRCVIGINDDDIQLVACPTIGRMGVGSNISCDTTL